MRALTVRQPWAQLLVMGTKTIETRSRRAPVSAIGQRIAITASAKRPPVYEHRDVNADLPPWINHVERHLDWVEHDDFHHGGAWHWIGSLGVVVGSGVLTASVPMIAGHGRSEDWNDPLLAVDGGTLMLYDALLSNGRDVSDQLPYGDFSPGRWAWLFDDLAPITERCPACWGDGFEHVGDFVDMFPNMYPEIIRPDCPLCGGAGRCAPVPVKGRLGVWNWTPEGSE